MTTIATTTSRFSGSQANASNAPKQASKQIGWAVKLHVTYTLAIGKGPLTEATDYQWIEGKTKAATLANAITEKSKQWVIPSTVACWIDSEMFPVTKPLL